MYPINVNDQRHLFTPKIVGAHIALCYYAGFAYLMMRRCVFLFLFLGACNRRRWGVWC